MSIGFCIKDLIEVPEVQTVIRLEDDLHSSQNITKNFVFTSDVSSHWSVLSEAFLKDSGRCYFLEGSYGSGKSHFLSVLEMWFERRAGHEHLRVRHEGLRKLSESSVSILPIDISLVKYRSSTSLEQIIIQAIERKLASHGFYVNISPLACFLQEFVQIVKNAGLYEEFIASLNIEDSQIENYLLNSSRQAYSYALKFLQEHGLNSPQMLVEERHQTFSRALKAVMDAGYKGFLLLIDELSEFFASKPDSTKLNEDARTLQFLGELSQDKPLWVIAAVQESIEQTGDISQWTLRKIKDRYPIKLTLSTLHIRELINQRLIVKKPNAIERISAIYKDFMKYFPQCRCSLNEFLDIYPLHPETLDLLDGLAELFSEHRGLVDFVYSQVGGNKTRNIEGILNRQAEELLAPDSIYSHFESRLSEYSAFNIYPKHIVPHLDQIIEKHIKDDIDVRLAKRIIRMLVLYKIHPTVSSPKLSKLAELSSCMISAHSPEYNMKYLDEVLLQPISETSQFLSRVSIVDGKTSALSEISYQIVTEDDPVKRFKQKINHLLEQVKDDDLRLIDKPLRELGNSVSWVGEEIFGNILNVSVAWRQSSRNIILTFLDSENIDNTLYNIEQKFATHEADCALMFSLESSFAQNVVYEKLDEKFIMLWLIPSPREGLNVLKEYHVISQMLSELKRTNPSHAPLIEIAEDRIKQIRPFVDQIILKAVFSGKFNALDAEIEPSARELRRFDKILERAAEIVLSKKYWKFPSICPPGMIPSFRQYQRLMDEFVSNGSISIRDARAKGLYEVIETLAVPLGICEMKSGSYILSADPNQHHLMEYVFSLVSRGEHKETTKLLTELRYGQYGMPKETACFLLLSLAHLGLICFMSQGRTQSLEFLRLHTVESTEFVVCGELLSKGDRETLILECPFLSSTQSWESFGLKQQRDAWQNAVRLKKSFESLAGELRRLFAASAKFSVLGKFDLESLEQKVVNLERLCAEIKVSYSAREGLERFLQAWRELAFSLNDIDNLQRVKQFLLKGLEQLVFISHYVQFGSVEAAANDDEEISASRSIVIEMLDKPERFILPDQGVELEKVFNEFRAAYLEYYVRKHTEYYKRYDQPKISKHAERILSVLYKLRAIESLDSPVGLLELLKSLEFEVKQTCNRHVVDEVLRFPTCSCGFRPETYSSEIEAENSFDLESAVSKALLDYVDILRSPKIIEVFTAYSYAQRDMNKTVSERIKQFCALLLGKAEINTVALIDVLDADMINHLQRALSGVVKVEKRNLSDVVSELKGRRLSKSKVSEVFANWLGEVQENAVLSLESDGLEGSSSENVRDKLGMVFSKVWSFIRCPRVLAPDVLQSEHSLLEQSLTEKLTSAELQKTLSSFDALNLQEFILSEPCFLAAAREAWLLLAQKVLSGEFVSEWIDSGSQFVLAEERVKIEKRLKCLRFMSESFVKLVPDCLQARLYLSEVASDVWATNDLQRYVQKGIDSLCAKGNDWLVSLPSVESIAFIHPLVVIVLDGVALDVWRACGSSVFSELGFRGEESWMQLGSEPTTIESLAQLFGVDGNKDALVALQEKNIRYENFSGCEYEELSAMMKPLEDEQSLVVRLAVFDKASHSGYLKLHEMPEVLNLIIRRQLAAFVKSYLAKGYEVIITADHGMSLKNGRLSHGDGGVFEEAVFRYRVGARA